MNFAKMQRRQASFFPLFAFVIACACNAIMFVLIAYTFVSTLERKVELILTFSCFYAIDAHSLVQARDKQFVRILKTFFFNFFVSFINQCL